MSVLPRSVDAVSNSDNDDPVEGHGDGGDDDDDDFVRPVGRSGSVRPGASGAMPGGTDCAPLGAYTPSRACVPHPGIASHFLLLRHAAVAV